MSSLLFGPPGPKFPLRRCSHYDAVRITNQPALESVRPLTLVDIDHGSRCAVSLNPHRIHRSGVRTRRAMAALSDIKKANALDPVA